ncbi:MAG TPA: hypothetical protein VE860_08860, partial [Chthoniobacterales bacterium]|nr:hypothetical protein [Chthoniobacterales bacterium]
AVSPPLQGASFAGSCSFPFPEGAEEGVWVFVAEQASRFAELKRRLQEVMFRQFSASVADQLAKASAFFCDAPLQGPAAHPQFFCHVGDLGTLSSQQPHEHPFNAGGDGLLRFPPGQFLV